MECDKGHWPIEAEGLGGCPVCKPRLSDQRWWLSGICEVVAAQAKSRTYKAFQRGVLLAMAEDEAFESGRRGEA